MSQSLPWESASLPNSCNSIYKTEVNTRVREFVELHSSIIPLTDEMIAQGVQAAVTEKYVRGALHRRLLTELVDAMLARGLVEVEVQDDYQCMGKWVRAKMTVLTPDSIPGSNSSGSHFFRL